MSASVQRDVHTVTVSPHPDAIRRRQVAEARHQQYMLQLQDTIQSYSGKLAADAPQNMLQVHNPCDLDSQIAAHARDDKLLVVHFKGYWCAACARMQYKLKQTAIQNPDIMFLVVDMGDAELFRHCTAMGVEHLPYFHFYKNGKVVSKFTCNLTKISLLRAEIAAHKGSPGSEPESLAYSAMEI